MADGVGRSGSLGGPAIALVVVLGMVSGGAQPALAGASPDSPGAAAAGFVSVIRDNVYETSVNSGGSRVVARGLDGAMHAVYSRDDLQITKQIFYARSADDGSTWSEERVTTGSGGDHYGPTVAVDQAGRVHVAWIGVGLGANPGWANVYYRSRGTNGSWAAIELVTDVAATQASPSLVVDAVGKLHLFWSGLGWGSNPGINNIRHGSRTTVWSTEAVTDVSVIQSQPAAGADLFGRVHVVWYGLGAPGNGSQNNIQYRAWAASGWDPVSWVTDDADDQLTPAVAVARNGSVHIVWTAFGEGVSPATTDILYRDEVSPGFWGPVVVLSDKTAHQSIPSVAVDQSGSVHVVWFGTGWGTSPSYYNLAHRERTLTWQPVGLLTNVPGSNQRPSIVSSLQPRGNGTSPSVPRDGLALAWISRELGGPDSMKFMTTSDHIWDDAPRAASLVAPPPNEWLATRRPLLSWAHDSPVGRAQAAYRVQITYVSDFSAVTYDTGRVPDAREEYVPDFDLDYWTWYWRAKTQDTLGLWGDWSLNRSFTLITKPTATLISPNGGEDWIKGRTYPILFQCRSEALTNWTVNLWYSPNNGDTWTSIVTGLALTGLSAGHGVYNWTVPSVNTANALVRVRCFDAFALNAIDISDASFAIDPPPEVQVPFSSPLAGAVWSAGAHTISWDPSHLSGGVDLAFTADAGATWNDIAKGLGNSGSFPWDVPALNTRAAQLRISGVSGEGAPIDSVGPFFVIDSTPPAIGEVRLERDSAGMATVVARVADNFGVARASLFLSREGSGFEEIPLASAGDAFIASFQAPGDIRYYVIASDGANEVNTGLRSLPGGGTSAVPLGATIVVALVSALGVAGAFVVNSRLSDFDASRRKPSRR